jgi:hypothetical protein
MDTISIISNTDSTSSNNSSNTSITSYQSFEDLITENKYQTRTQNINSEYSINMPDTTNTDREVETPSVLYNQKQKKYYSYNFSGYGRAAMAWSGKIISN